MAGFKENLKTAGDVLATKCPTCRSQNMFVYPVYRLDKVLMMHRYCPNCDQDFVQEPGFYFGAMYFSYALNIAIMVFFGVAYEVLFDPQKIFETLLSVFIPAIIFAPYNFRISRALMLYIFGRRRKMGASQKHQVAQS